MTATTTRRTLSLHERYAVARRCIGTPSIVTAAALLELESHANSDEALETLRRQLALRIDEAFAQYPLLGYCVQAPRSKAPRWSPITPSPTAAQVLHVGPTLTPLPSDQDCSALLSAALLDAQSTLSAYDVERDVLWRVQLHRIQTAGDAAATCLVLLATDHVINDGIGTLNLFRTLLQRPTPTSTTTTTTNAASSPRSAGTSPSSVPPSSNEVFNFSPSARYMLGVVWQELVLPKLPLSRAVKAKLRGPVSWPASCVVGNLADVACQPRKCPPALDLLLVTAPGLITNLKQVAKRHVASSAAKPATLHAVVHTVALAALYAAIAHAHSVPPSALDSFNTVLGSGTPISLRQETPPSPSNHKSLKRFCLPRSTPPAAPLLPGRAGLPGTTGNFVASYTDTFALHGRATSFWTMANRFAAQLASPRGRKLAKMHMGMLGYIPDFERAHHDEKDAVGYRNGWEKFFGDKALGSQPYDAALTVSNLGFLDLAQLGVPCASPAPASGEEGKTDSRVAGWSVAKVCWAQSHTPQGEAFGVDVIGSSTAEGLQSLSIGIASRPSAFRDGQLHTRFVTYFRTLLLALATTTTVADAKNSHESTPSTPAQTLDPRNNPSFADLARFLNRLN